MSEDGLGSHSVSDLLLLASLAQLMSPITLRKEAMLQSRTSPVDREIEPFWEASRHIDNFLSMRLSV